MSLDLQKAAAQLDRLATQLAGQHAARATALAQAQRMLAEANPRELKEKQDKGRYTWLAAVLEKELAAKYPAAPLVTDYAVVATDGSHIDVDRHAPARTSLINMGHVLLRYGELPDALLWSSPTLYVDESELVLRDQTSELRETALEGPLLGMKRTVLELAALADLIDEVPLELPILALVDGSLIMWGLAGQGYPDFVRRELLENGLIPALDRLREQAKHRRLAVAGYVSLPGGRDVVNTLRLHLCPYTPVDCDSHCRRVRPGERECDMVAILHDRDLFGAFLSEGQRTPIYHSASSVVTQALRRPCHVLLLPSRWG